ncbi:LPS export ABC transporter periplasmic protein LptC [Motilimonas pumila]|uniref:Lipopolysaccharide export system protein LptC n=1 Tax=Motilimonas pumila TaxID=2303987 RepID=A0A418YI07_9GAMM|nr:LPS export ABC transporter periplasmic protein LptC [Motilimonas pumila]RJG50002.1 LPS export ABC transporter periplasmic protein LptC [Motilimonas pumila]
MNKLNVSTFCCFILSLALWRFFGQEQKETQPIDPSQPYFVAKNTTTDTYNPLGQLDYTVKANKITYFRTKEVTQFEQPDVTVFRNNKQTIWQINSLNGTLHQQSTLELIDQVKASNLTHDQHIHLIKTEKISIDLLKNELHSKELVTFYGDQIEQRGKGLFANLDDQRASLLTNVTATYLNDKP